MAARIGPHYGSQRRAKMRRRGVELAARSTKLQRSWVGSFGHSLDVVGVIRNAALRRPPGFVTLHAVAVSRAAPRSRAQIMRPIHAPKVEERANATQVAHSSHRLANCSSPRRDCDRA